MDPKQALLDLAKALGLNVPEGTDVAVEVSEHDAKSGAILQGLRLIHPKDVLVGSGFRMFKFNARENSITKL